MALAVPDRAHDGSRCFVCGADLELVPIPHSNAGLCRACVPKLGEVLSTASFALLEQWFVTAPDERAHHASGGRASWGASAREGSRSTVDEPSANVLVRYGLSAPTTDESTRTHLGLAEVYDEMSLVQDAIREAAHVLWRFVRGRVGGRGESAGRLSRGSGKAWRARGHVARGAGARVGPPAWRVPVASHRLPSRLDSCHPAPMHDERRLGSLEELGEWAQDEGLRDDSLVLGVDASSMITEVITEEWPC